METSAADHAQDIRRALNFFLGESLAIFPIVPIPLRCIVSKWSGNGSIGVLGGQDSVLHRHGLQNALNSAVSEFEY